ncbi:CAP domain-containing protein, partial [Streptomyces gobitricini]|uniref:CAP domain-containing protein n=1 Tax=Streptomyces gobitricini TaxID=68211 RepID=UPI0031D7A70D
AAGAARRVAGAEPGSGGETGTPRAGGAPVVGAPAVGAPVVGASAVAAAAEYAERVLALVDAERAKAGCRPLRRDSRLRSAAQGHADDMAARGYYAHDNPEGRDAGDRMAAAGYDWRTWGENIHRGPRNAARAVRDWMASSEHRKNIVNCAFKDIGVGVNLRSNGPWWVQNFAAAG